jgi:GrpB-like predicted nucleotidyltransferase (UPF0157 family)/GNAT superfamily N-acetyltransferase
MEFSITEEPITALGVHAQISIAFTVDRVLEASGGYLQERAIQSPYLKDYDAIPGNHPTEWPRLFDVTQWGLLSAWSRGRRIGGAVIAVNTPGLEMLEGRDDLALLWDLRVAAEARGNGVGGSLLGRAEEWAQRRGYRELKIETQNVNVIACRLYERHGCYVLAQVNAGAYPACPDELQVIWRKPLTRLMEIVDYDSGWPTRYHVERQRIEEALKEKVLAVHHIGSTAVPGLRAKPVIDILVAITGAPEAADLDPTMCALGYTPRGELGIAGRGYFTKQVNGIRTHQVHVYEAGHPNIAKHLAFRDCLRAHPEIAAEYARVKQGAAQAHTFHSGDYGRAKARFIERIIAEALKG